MMHLARLVIPVAAGLVLAATPAAAEMLVAARTVPARTVLAAGDLMSVEGKAAGALTRIDDAVGLETRVPIYAGRPVRAADLGPAAMIDRNEIVILRFLSGALVIEADGRALDRAEPGAGVRVMNLSSRTTVVGRAIGPGIVEVGQ